MKEREFNEGLRKQKDGEWYLTMLKKGTATDKISSLAMLVQQDPHSTLPYLMQLLGLAKKPNRKMAEQAVVAFKDLFVQGHLIGEEHQNQKLHVFTRNPVIIHKRAACSDVELLQAYYEHCIREIIRDFVTSVLQ